MFDHEASAAPQIRQVLLLSGRHQAHESEASHIEAVAAQKGNLCGDLLFAAILFARSGSAPVETRLGQFDE